MLKNVLIMLILLNKKFSTKHIYPQVYPQKKKMPCKLHGLHWMNGVWGEAESGT